MPNTIFAVANRKGGVGKTTTAITVAHGLAQRIADGGGRVLLIDFDPQGNVATSLKLEPRNRDLADLLLGRAEFRDCVISADRAAEGFPRPNLFVLPSNDSLAEAKGELMIKSAIGGRKATPIEDVLHEKLSFTRDLFNYIVVDCPPTLDVFSDAVYRLADEAIVPVKTDFLGEVGTARHTNDILEAQSYGIDIQINCILPTFYDRRLTIARSVLAALQTHYGKATVATPIPRSTVFEQAPAVDGQTILEYRPNSTAAQAYQELIDRIHTT